MKFISILGLLFAISFSGAYSQCPTSGTISSDCTSANLTITNNTLTVNAGVTVTVTGTLTIRGNSTISGSSTSVFNIGDISEAYGNPAGNILSGGTYNVAGDITSGGGGPFTINSVDLDITGDFEGDGSTVTISNSVMTVNEFDADAGTVTIDNSQVNADTLFTNGGTTLNVQNGSEFFVTRGMWNAENLVIDNALLDIGGDLDATGGDNITVRNDGELIVRGDYKMNNGGGVQLDLEDGGLVRVLGDVESTSGGNSIDVDDDSAISVGGDFTGGSPPSVSVGTNDEDADCLTGGGCCGDAAACGSATTLPVTLIDFIAEKINDQVLLTWRTGTEINNDYFTIEKSSNGVDFSGIATISGSGTSNNVSEYSYADKSAFSSSLVYYRLSQTDYDGTHEKLKVSVVGTSSTLSSFEIYPNPIENGKIHVLGMPLNSEWTILSLSGQSISSGQLGGENEIEITNIPSGAYLLSFKGSQKIERIVIK